MNSDIRSKTNDIVLSFKQLPYLFVGTGFSMRYSNAPSWNELLMQIWVMINDSTPLKYKKFIRIISEDLELDYSRIDEEERKYYLNPLAATIIQKQFNNKCLTDDEFERRLFLEEEVNEILEKNYDYFKYYISKITTDLKLDMDKANIKELKSLIDNQNKIAGIITTNYDCLLENVFRDFGVMVGQDNLLISNMNNIFEIFKIHGSCDKPTSIIITQNDYEDFKDKLKYISAKLLTIFVEHPVIFIGYSIGDLNIRAILKEISDGLTHEQLNKLRKNLVFISPVLDENQKEEIRLKEIDFNGKRIGMTEIVLKDFSDLYLSFKMIKSSMPVKIIRKMQDMLCNYIATTEATKNVMVGSIDSPNITDEQIGIYIGSLNSVSDMGFGYYEIWDIIEDILFDNKPYLMNKMIFEKTFKIIRSTAGKTFLPIYKYLQGLRMDNKSIPPNWYIVKNYNSLNLTTVENNYVRNAKQFDSIIEIENEWPNHYPRQFAHILNSKVNIEVEELGEYLKNIYLDEETKNRWSSEIKKLVALYDFKKYAL